MGERVNKIRFVGSINKEVRLESVTLSDLLGKERNARVKEKRMRGLRFHQFQVRVRLIIL